MNKQILIIDYDLGNTHSVSNALKLLGYKVRISRQIDDIEQSDALILPGVGAFGEAIANLNKYQLVDVLNEQVMKHKKPVLGICLGMQIFAESSEEDPSAKGLGWIEGTVMKIDGPKNDLRIPHVGWNNLEVKKREPLFSKYDPEANFYFDHSYYFHCDERFVASQCLYGNWLTAAVQKNNIYGVQFHPEKSQTNGQKLFRSLFTCLGF